MCFFSTYMGKLGHESSIFWGIVGWGWNLEAMFGCEAWHGSHHGVGFSNHGTPKGHHGLDETVPIVTDFW